MVEGRESVAKATSPVAAGVIGAVVGAVAAVVGSVATIATGYFTFASKDQELRVRLIEIGISILRADPKEDVAPARAWAIDVIEQKSGVTFNKEDRAALLHKPIQANISIIGLDAMDQDLQKRLQELANTLVNKDKK